MQYTLITRTGTIYQFYFLGLAECYQVIHGGVILTQDLDQLTNVAHQQHDKIAVDSST